MCSQRGRPHGRGRFVRIDDPKQMGGGRSDSVLPQCRGERLIGARDDVIDREEGFRQLLLSSQRHTHTLVSCFKSCSIISIIFKS